MKSKKLKELVEELQRRSKVLLQGGGTDKQSIQHKKGKLTARERITQLLDKDSELLEIGLFAAYEMYKEEGGCPAAGVIVGTGRISGHTCVIVAGDATIKAGAWFPMTAKKNLRAQEIAMENRLPVVYLVDSAGVFLPLQEEIFPDKFHFGRQFRNNAHISAMGIVQIAAIMGSCVAGGAYLPAMCDESYIVEGTGSVFLAGSYLVKAAVGEEIDNETLGGSHTQTALSGVVDKSYPDDISCLKAIRRTFSRMPTSERADLNRSKSLLPSSPSEKIYDILPEERQRPYDMQELLYCIIDKESLDTYKPNYGKTLICAYARIDGWAVGIVANERQVVRTAKGEMQMGGVIYSDAANKATRFIMNCNQRHLPIVFFHDVSGFMVGSRAEHGGIIKDGAKMVNAVANSIVPKFSVLVGNSFGAGNYAMCGKAYDPRLCVAWPSALLGVMSGESAAQTLLQTKLKNKKKLTEEESTLLLEQIKNQYNKTLSPYYAASRLWIDAIIVPTETRKVLSEAIHLSDHAKITKPFVTGVLQT